MSNTDDMVGCGDFLSDGGSRTEKLKIRVTEGMQVKESESKSAKTNKSKHEEMKARTKTTLCSQE